MKFGLLCERHVSESGTEDCISGGVKWQCYLAKELLRRGHEFHFFLRIPNRPKWFDTTGIHYHPRDEVFNHTGDVLLAPWRITSEYLQHERLKQQWKKRILVLHDAETALNHNAALEGDHYIMSVSSMLASIASTYMRVTAKNPIEHRILPNWVPCGVNPDIFNICNRTSGYSYTYPIIGIIGVQDENRVGDYRGIDICKQIADKLVVKNSNITIKYFTGKTEQKMADHYKSVHYLLELPLLAGCPTSVIEAMACGTIPITTYAGTTDIINNMINGVLLPKINIDYSVNTIINFLTEDVYEMNHTQMLRQLRYTDFSWSRMTDKFLENLEYC